MITIMSCKDKTKEPSESLAFPYRCWSLKLEKRCMKAMGVWETFKKQRGSFGDSLHEAFSWHLSTEGHAFWSDVADRIGDFMSLVEAVERIDPDVAKWMQKGVFKEDPRLSICGSLSDAFIFSLSPFKHEYIYRLWKDLPPEHQ